MEFTQEELETISQALEELRPQMLSRESIQEVDQLIERFDEYAKGDSKLHPDSKLPLITIQWVNENSEYDGPNTDPITHYLVRRTETELETIDSNGDEWGFEKSRTGGDPDLWYEINSEGAIRVLDAAP